jgi:hypothetical protein
MRLWSLHPRYLDARGLVALWREALLAQAVLRGRTRGYRRHPQLERFAAAPSPLGAIGAYLRGVDAEARTRGYAFQSSKIGRTPWDGRLAVTRGQLQYEREHLVRKLRVRDPERLSRLRGIRTPDPHPLFRIVAGGVAEWEKVLPALGAIGKVRLGRGPAPRPRRNGMG